MNVKICKKCGKIGLDQLDFGITWQGRSGYNYRGQCSDCKNLQTVKWCKDNPEIIKQWRKDNADKILLYMKALNKQPHRNAQKKQWKKDNPDWVKEYAKAHPYDAKKYDTWRRANLDKRRDSNRRYRAKKAGLAGTHTKEEIGFIYDFQQGICPSCKQQIPFDEMSVDHITPISWKGSTDWPNNIQLLCKSCNSSKCNYSDIDYRENKPIFFDEIIGRF